MAVSYVSGNGKQNNTQLFADPTLTVTSDANRVLLLQIGWETKAANISSVVWDNGGTNQAMTLIRDQAATGTYGRCALYGLVNPTAGTTLTCYVTFDAATDSHTWVSQWNGVNQTGGTTTFAHANSATATNATPSITITSASGNAVVDSVAINEGYPVATTAYTQLYSTDQGDANVCASRTDGAASVTLSWSSQSHEWASVGCDIVAVVVVVPGLMWLH